MAGYKRFVAYVYEYQGEQKKENRGFVKVEARDGRCVIEVHLQCPRLAPEQVCEVFGFVRRGQELIGVSLGNCRTKPGRVDCRLEHMADHLLGGPAGLEDLGGMVIRIGEQGFYGTQWDDQPISPMSFVIPRAEEEKAAEKEKMPEAEEPQELPKDMPQENHSFPDMEMEATEQVFLSEESKERMLPAAEEKPEQTERTEETMPEGEEPDQAPERSQAPEYSCAEESQAETRMPVAEERQEPRQTVPVWEEKENGFWPFEDGEITNCIRICPGDFRFFTCRERGLGSNRFLLHGYQQFGHLLLGKIRGSSQYVVGVPGVYEQQERMMANMFGFPHFKAGRVLELAQEEGRGGYWYRLVNTPNLHQLYGRR